MIFWGTDHHSQAWVAEMDEKHAKGYLFFCRNFMTEALLWATYLSYPKLFIGQQGENEYWLPFPLGERFNRANSFKFLESKRNNYKVKSFGSHSIIRIEAPSSKRKDYSLFSELPGCRKPQSRSEIHQKTFGMMSKEQKRIVKAKHCNENILFPMFPLRLTTTRGV